MDMIQFSKSLPDILSIFKNYFEEHVVAYNLLRGVDFVKINDVVTDESSIVYSVELLDDEDINRLIKYSNNIRVDIYGKTYKPNIYLNNGLLHINITCC